MALMLAGEPYKVRFTNPTKERRWPNNKTTLGQPLKFVDVDPMLFYCWANVADAGSTLKQHSVNVSSLRNSRG